MSMTKAKSRNCFLSVNIPEKKICLQMTDSFFQLIGQFIGGFSEQKCTLKAKLQAPERTIAFRCSNPSSSLNGRVKCFLKANPTFCQNLINASMFAEKKYVHLLLLIFANESAKDCNCCCAQLHNILKGQLPWGRRTPAHCQVEGGGLACNQVTP